MTDPKHLSIANFDYPLPDSRIAAYPAPNRHDSRLLVYENGNISEDVFRNLHTHLPSHSLMVLNNTRVVEARIIFQKPTGARIEIFCLEPGDEYPDITTALAQHGTVTWKCMVGRASSWQHQTVLEKKLDDDHTLYAKIISKESDYFIVQLSWVNENISFAEVLHFAGSTPLPPYIKRKPESSDLERYQTVYAHYSGSVAAPTAGLHFTPEVMKDIEVSSIDCDYVTLHVGAGTFKPVKSESMSSHEMHAEFIEVRRSLLEKLVSGKNVPVIAVGTTSLRTLESVYWIGVRVMENSKISGEDLHIQQWEPYERPSSVSLIDAVNALIAWMDERGVSSLITRTSLLIAPSYRFRVVDILITNFHQPRSTLLLLVAAFIGEDWRRVYAHALENGFRFLSYGDGCLFFRR